MSCIARVLIGAAVVASLVTPIHPVDAATIGLYFDRAGTVQSVDVPLSDYPLEDLDIHVIVHGADGPIDQFVFGISHTPGAFVVGMTMYGTESIIDPCTFGSTLGSLQCFVDCDWEGEDPLLIATVHALVLPSSPDPIYAVGAATGDRAPAGSPFVVTCGGSQIALEPAESLYGPGAAAVNATSPVGAAGSSWSRIKSLYAGPPEN